ncbi:RNA-directed DNA polymerase, eukaryota, reverse transcriptase zinc-binding domain protein, partial [Tanacetum coccineum]
DKNKVDKDVTFSDDSSVDEMEDVIKNLHTGIEDEEPNIRSPKANVEVSSFAKEPNASDLSCPPGFKYMKRDYMRRCSTSFAKRQNKDIKAWLAVDQEVDGKTRGNYILFGDMNEVRNAQERHGSFFSRSKAEVFNTFIINSNLIDLPMGGHLFTWMNKQGTKLSKLDQFLISEEVLNLLPDIKITILDRFYLSSHDKLKALKLKIRLWHNTLRSKEISHKQDVIKSLKILEGKIDAGYGTTED